MTKVLSMLQRKILISRPFLSRYLSRYMVKNVFSSIIGVATNLYSQNTGFSVVLDMLSGTLSRIKKIVVALPSSSAGAYLAAWWATGRVLTDSTLIVAYVVSEEYVLNLILHELAHEWIGTQVDIHNLYEETLAYFLSFKAGFGIFYDEQVRHIINVFSRYKPSIGISSPLEYEITTIVLPRVIASILSRDVDLDDINNFLALVLRNPSVVFQKLETFATREELRSIGCMLSMVNPEIVPSTRLLELCDENDELPLEEFLSLLEKSNNTEYFDEHEYLYENLVMLLLLPLASKIYGAKKAKHIFKEFLSDAKTCSEEVYEYLNNFVESPDAFIEALYESSDMGSIPRNSIDNALKDARKILDKLYRAFNK